MPMQHYGVWKGAIKRFDNWDSRTDPASPHVHLIFTDDSGDDVEVSVNVKSSDKILSQIVYWKNSAPNFFKSSNIIAKLNSLEEARFYDAAVENGPRIDFLRDGFIALKDGLIPPWSTENIPDDDIIDFLQNVVKNAINKDATLFVFGQQYQPDPRTGVLDKKGIHQIHMNQGSFFDKKHPNWYKENGVGQDGGLLFRYPDGTWEAFFLAFASQAWTTDNEGKPTSGNLMDYLGQSTVRPPPVVSPTIRIHSALVNPTGPDNNPVLEQVKIENNGQTEVTLTGWHIQNQDGKVQELLPTGITLAANGGQADYPAGDCYLTNNRDGTILLKDNQNREVDIVEYKKSQAAQEGMWIPFH